MNMNNQTKILFLSQNDDFSKLVKFSLQSNFNFNVTQYSESSPIETIMDSTNNFYLVLVDGSVPHEEALSCLEKAKAMNLKVPFFVVGTKSYLSDLQSYNAVLIDRNGALESVEENIRNLFVENPMVKPIEFCPVHFNLLLAFKALQCDVYIKMPTGRYLKIFKQEDQIHKGDVDKYEKKGVDSLYLKKKTAFWILKEIREKYPNIHENLANGDEMIIDSPPAGIDQLASDNSSSDTRDLSRKENSASALDDTNYLVKKSKSYSTSENDTDLADEIANLQKELSSDDLQNSFNTNLSEEEEEEVKRISRQVDGTFKLSADFKEELNVKVSKALGVMAKSKAVKGLLKKLNVDRNPDQYFKIHVNLLCKLTVAIANLLEWNTESTLEKLIYVSYMHDITMLEHPHLARLQTMEDFENIKEDLSEDEIELFLKHPADIKKLIEDTRGHPVGAEEIVFQHHEFPSGKGFPNKLSGSRVLPLSAVFIMAHDLTNYILDNPNWDLEVYIQRSKKRFVGANFTKVIRKLGDLKK
jgi:HD-GYP domain-containing protein (c-di-GMP phosphodiesterase class II)